MKELPHTRSCFVCGESNPAGFKLRLETDGQIVRTWFVPGAEHVGFRQTVHGGLIATLLDEAMVWACAVRAKQFAYCAELQVRFIHPARPQEPVRVEARMTANRRGRLYEANAELSSEDGRLLATATGKYLPIKDADAAAMAADFVGDPAWVFGLA
jgi:uncharacterized protein (TIGR00369 family)